MTFPAATRSDSPSLPVPLTAVACASSSSQKDGLQFLLWVSGADASAYAPDQYWLTVMALFESSSHLEHVVRAARLALHGSQSPKMFW